jgi:hypothetical protein
MSLFGIVVRGDIDKKASQAIVKRNGVSLALCTQPRG